MVKKKIAFVLAVFCATVLLMAVQKPVFLAYYAADAAQASVGEWLGVVWHGLTLDMTVAGYVTALPLLAVLLSLWVRIPERVWRGVLTAYFALIAVVTAVIFAVDVALYEHWGFRIDATVLIYLSDPEEAMASVDFWLGVRQTLLAAVYFRTGNIWVTVFIHAAMDITSMLIGGLYGTQTVADSISTYDITMLTSIAVYLIPTAFLLRKKKIGEVELYFGRDMK